jgi:hypothetical protein
MWGVYHLALGCSIALDDGENALFLSESRRRVPNFITNWLPTYALFLNMKATIFQVFLVLLVSTRVSVLDCAYIFPQSYWVWTRRDLLTMALINPPLPGAYYYAGEAATSCKLVREPGIPNGLTFCEDAFPWRSGGTNKLIITCDPGRLVSCIFFPGFFFSSNRTVPIIGMEHSDGACKLSSLTRVYVYVGLTLVALLRAL